VSETVTQVLAPCPGRLVSLADTPDPVFASEMVGPGVAIEPEPHEATVVSPIAGKVVKVHPHAFVVLGSDGVGVLVHLGINTVRLEGQGFEVLTTQGATVAANTPMVRWDPSTISGDGLSTLVLVVAMDGPKGSVPAPAAGAVAAVGDVLFTVTS
jgi:glucose-specific phosphotransferase system IIA component